MFSDNDFILGMQQGFLEAFEWAEAERLEQDYESYQEGNGFTDAAIAYCDMEVKAFYEANKELLRESGLTPDQCGHDFYLTSQGHGVGFWDRGRLNKSV